MVSLPKLLHGCVPEPSPLLVPPPSRSPKVLRTSRRPFPLDAAPVISGTLLMVLRLCPSRNDPRPMTTSPAFSSRSRSTFEDPRDRIEPPRIARNSLAMAKRAGEHLW